MNESEIVRNKWCLNLVKEFVAMSPESEFTPKGGSRSKLDQADETGRERREEERETEEKESSAKQVEVPSRELLNLIDNYRPSQRAEEDLEPIVPNKLPSEIRTNIAEVSRQDFTKCFQVDAALKRVEELEGIIKPVELVCLYLRSIRNILKYDLADIKNWPKEITERINGYCAHVIQDVLEALGLLPDSEQDPPQRMVSIVAMQHCVLCSKHAPCPCLQ